MAKSDSSMNKRKRSWRGGQGAGAAAGYDGSMETVEDRQESEVWLTLVKPSLKQLRTGRKV